MACTNCCSHRLRLPLLLLLLLAASTDRILAFTPVVSVVSWNCGSYGSTSPTLRLRASNNKSNDGEEEDQDKMVSDFFFNISKSNMNGRRSMDDGIQQMISGNGGYTASSLSLSQSRSAALAEDQLPSALVAKTKAAATVVVMDWECLLDALPYHVELGIHAARTVWPHLNDLCNFDTDRQWLENKLYAMSHVLGCPEGPDRTKHVACEFALATRLILEEQALDRNESTGKNGKYSRKFHPRSEINGSEKFREKARSRRPLTAGELAVNWREFIRSTLLVKYSRVRGPDGNTKTIEPTLELERAIEDYLRSSSSRSSAASTNKGRSRVVASKSLPLFAQTKFALRNSSTKLVVRISHRFDNEIVARNLNRQLQLAPHERIAKTYKPENAIRRLFLNEDKNMVLLLQPEFDNPKYECSKSNDNDKIVGSSNSNQPSRVSAEERCLHSILRFTHECNQKLVSRIEEQQDGETIPSSSKPTTPSVVWVDSSWHRLQPLAPIFGDAIPGLKNGKKNTAKCKLRLLEGPDENDAPPNLASVWLSLYLAEWPAIDTASETTLISTSENHQAAMVYPWTDCLSWDDAEDILLPTNWGLSDTAFQ